MKSILTTIAFLALAVSGLAQTRSVIVNTSGVVQSPTNFWSANVTNAFSGLGLGTAATNAASAFQPSSLVLSNLSSSNGGELTNLTASNITGIVSISNGGSSATTAGGARTNLGLGVTNNVRFNRVVAPYFQSTSSNAIIELDDNQFILTAAQAEFRQPIFFNNTTNASTTRTNLGLGATWLTNTNVTNFRTAVGLGSTNFVIFNGLEAMGAGIEASGILLSGSNATLSFEEESAKAQTRTNLGLGWSALTNSNTATALLGYNTNNGNVVMPSSITFSNNVDFSKSIFAATNGISVGGTLFAGSGSTISFYGTEDQSRWRTNLGGTTVGNAVFTASNAATAATAIGLGTSNDVTFNRLQIGGAVFDQVSFSGGDFEITGGHAITFVSGGNPATTRTNLGLGATWLTNTNVTNFRTAINLGWSALTNANTAGFNASAYGSGTNPVLYNTNGEVVSPTNFWQVAPIVTRFVESQPTTNQTTNIAAARNLHIHSLNTNVINVTNTIVLPENNSFNGDIALVVHKGSTSGATLVKADYGYTTLATMNKFGEAVEFVYYNNTWQFNHNQSFVEPIFFSGDNAVDNVAESRTNLGLGSTNDVTFSTLTLSSDLTLGDGDNIVLSTTTGTKIGTATNQLIGFYNQTPITRPSSTGVTTNGFVANGPANGVHANSTFTGGIGTKAYTISDVVAHLKSLGLLAP